MHSRDMDCRFAALHCCQSHSHSRTMLREGTRPARKAPSSATLTLFGRATHSHQAAFQATANGSQAACSASQHSAACASFVSPATARLVAASQVLLCVRLTQEHEAGKHTLTPPIAWGDKVWEPQGFCSFGVRMPGEHPSACARLGGRSAETHPNMCAQLAGPASGMGKATLLVGTWSDTEPVVRDRWGCRAPAPCSDRRLSLSTCSTVRPARSSVPAMTCAATWKMSFVASACARKQPIASMSRDCGVAADVLAARPRQVRQWCACQAASAHALLQ